MSNIQYVNKQEAEELWASKKGIFASNLEQMLRGRANHELALAYIYLRNYPFDTRFRAALVWRYVEMHLKMDGVWLAAGRRRG